MCEDDVSFLVISLFIKSDVALPELISIFENIGGHTFERYSHNGFDNYVMWLLGVEVNLFSDHGLVDDGGIAFSSYQYEVDFEILRPYLSNEYVNRVFRLMPFVFVKQLTGVEWIVVEDLQRLIDPEAR